MQLPHIASIDVAEVLVTIRCRVLGLLTRRGVIASTDSFELLDSAGCLEWSRARPGARTAPLPPR